MLGVSVVFALAINSKLKFDCCFLLLFSLSISLKKLFAKFSDSISNESSDEVASIVIVVASLRIVVDAAVVDDLTKVKISSFTAAAISLLTFENDFNVFIILILWTTPKVCASLWPYKVNKIKNKEALISLSRFTHNWRVDFIRFLLIIVGGKLCQTENILRLHLRCCFIF